MFPVNPEYFLKNKLSVFECYPSRKPKQEGWRELEYWFIDAEEANDWSCYAVAIESDWLVIDVDLRKPEAHTSFAKLCEFIDFEDCFKCRTARGGWHYWFKKPTLQPVRKKLHEYPGIDFLSEGCYVIGPGSVADTGVYIFDGGELGDSPDVPEDLLYKLRKFEAAAQAGSSFVQKDVEFLRYKQWLDAQPQAVEGENGNDYTYNMVAYGFDFGLSEGEILEAAQDWNLENTPPWSVDELKGIIANAGKYAQNSKGKAAINFEVFESAGSLPDNDGSPDSELEDDDKLFDRLHPGITLTYRGDSIQATGSNLRIMLLNERYRGLFRFDAFRYKITLDRIPPWRSNKADITLEMTELDWRELRIDLSMKARLDVSQGLLEDGVYSLAAARSFHPICDWLNSLKWDGAPRFDKVFGAGEYRATIAKIFVLASIYRIFYPGYKFDHMLVLAGRQGLAKSYFVQIMGGEYAIVMQNAPTDRKGLQELQGAWWIEFPELSALKRADINQVKAFITSTKDTYIPMYGRAGAQTFPRICVPVWTLNPTEAGFLTDDQNRRFLIVEILEKLDIEYLKTNREQIFAEAMEMYRQGIQPYKLVELIAGEAEDIANQNKQDDLWETLIAEWVIKGNRTEVSTKDIFTDVLGCWREIDFDKKAQMRIASCLVKLGFKRIKSNGKSAYVKEDKESIV